MMREIGSRLNFKYKFYTPADNKYGSEDKSTGAWSGMIGEVMKKQGNLVSRFFTHTAYICLHNRIDTLYTTVNMHLTMSLTDQAR